MVLQRLTFSVGKEPLKPTELQIGIAECIICEHFDAIKMEGL